MSKHENLCVCDSCRTPSKIIDGEKYELRQHRETKEYKYFKMEKCFYCEKGFIIKTKLFDRCEACGKDIKEAK